MPHVGDYPEKSNEMTEIWETLGGFKCVSWLNSSSTVWMVNHWYTQVGKGEQSCKKSIIGSLISLHQKELWFTPGQRDQERMCLQITASASQPPKATLTTHTPFDATTPQQIFQHPVIVTSKQNHQPPVHLPTACPFMQTPWHTFYWFADYLAHRILSRRP